MDKEYFEIKDKANYDYSYDTKTLTIMIGNETVETINNVNTALEADKLYYDYMKNTYGITFDNTLVTVTDISISYDKETIEEQLLGNSGLLTDLGLVKSYDIEQAMNDEDRFDLAYDALRHNRISESRFFGVPETVQLYVENKVIPFANDFDEYIENAIIEDWGYYIKNDYKTDITDNYTPVTISDIIWDYDDDNISNQIEDNDVLSRLGLITPEQEKTMDDDEKFEIISDALHHNKVTAEQFFGLPEKMVIYVPNTEMKDIADMNQYINEKISDGYGFCIEDYTTDKDDMFKQRDNIEYDK